jgi:hypothetical protein
MIYRNALNTLRGQFTFSTAEPNYGLDFPDVSSFHRNHRRSAPITHPLRQLPAIYINDPPGALIGNALIGFDGASMAVMMDPVRRLIIDFGLYIRR